jgi:hypothetical protein
MAAVFGLLVLLAGLIGAAVLFYTSQQRPEQTIDGYARAAVGCQTTLRFVDTGTFYVFEERGSDAEAPPGDCPPTADPDRAFGFVLSDGTGQVEGQGDLGISYDTGDRMGQSVAKFVVDEPGEYTIDVFGGDVAVVAAIGQDPDEGVAELRRAAVIVGGIGVALGGLLLLLAGRRSKRAAAVQAPEAGRVWRRPPEPTDDRRGVPHVPVSSPTSSGEPDAPAPVWPPEPPSVSEPSWDDRSRVPDGSPPAPPPPPAGMPSDPGAIARSPWAPPAPGQQTDLPSPPPPPHGSTNGDDGG